MRKKTPREARESALASGWTVEAGPSTGASDADLQPEIAEIASDGAADLEESSGSDSDEVRTSNATLVLLGVFGALYLLYAWIWLSWTQALSAQHAADVAASGALSGGLQQVVFWLAPLAPILWFTAAFAMNARRGTKRLLLWILVGAVVLLPLPVFSAGGVA